MAQNCYEPERGKLEFEGCPTSQNASIVEIIDKIQKVSSEVLFHWKSYPIILPPSLLDDNSVNLKDLFILPTFDELESLTTDAKGNPKFLIHNQLQSIKRRGQFTVSSINFPSQVHVWKLNSIFQKGIETAREEYLDGIAFGLRFVLIYAPRLICGERHSLKKSIATLFKNLLELIDLFIGIGKVHVPNLEKRIHEERCKFLVAELKCKGEGSREIGRYVRNQSNKARREKVTMAMERPPPIPYKFTTPVAQEVDLRLFDRDIFHKISQPLSRILEKSSRGWFLSFREKVIGELRSKKLSESEIEMEANVMVVDEYLRRVYNAVRVCPEIQEIGQDIDKLLIEQAKQYLLMHRAVDKVSVKLESHLSEKRKDLVGNYPILSRDQAWLNVQMEKYKYEFCEDNKWLPHEIALDVCRDHFLRQQSYFLARDLVFMRDTEHVLRKEIQCDKVPSRTFEWKSIIWRPQNYVITKTVNGISQVVPTVISETTGTTLNSPRTNNYNSLYSMDRMEVRMSSCRWYFWRIFNFFLRLLTWFQNSIYYLAIFIPYNSPLSLRSLLHTRPYHTSLYLNDATGTLCYKATRNPTLVSMLTNIWRNVSKGRTRFESGGDGGFLGKDWSRVWNRVWNYGIRGFGATIGLLLGFPIISLTVSILSILLALTAIFWMPVFVFVFHLLCIFVYDFDCPLSPTSSKRRYFKFFTIIGSILIHGLLESFLCTLGALIICPLVSLTIILWALINYGVRLGWDSVMFYSLIKPKGRLPSGNSWLVKRIIGPGLAPEFYFKISIEQALIAFQTRLETEELLVFFQKSNQLISEPLLEYKKFFTACFTPFSGKIIETEGPYRDLVQQTQILRLNLEEKVLKRRKELETGLNVGTRARIRMEKSDLEKTLLGARRMCSNFYPNKIFSRMREREEIESYWEGRGLEVCDWMNLTILLISEVFSEDFLCPLEDSDISFNLSMTMKGSPVPVDDLINEIEESELWSDEVVTMSKIKYQIHSPYLELSSFNPLSKSNSTSDNLISKYISIPLPIPHPVYISVIIHNRETEHPFQLESPICQAILKALQDSGPMLNQDCISLDVETSISSDELDESLNGPFDETDDIFQIENLSAHSTPLPTGASAVIYIPNDGKNNFNPLKPMRSLKTREKKTPQLTLPIGPLATKEGTNENYCSKVSLASPEELSLEEGLSSQFGTSV